MSLFNRLQGIFNTYRKNRTLLTLRSLPEYQLRDIGVDPAMLRQGITGWPWRMPSDHWVSQSKDFPPKFRAQVTHMDSNPIGYYHSEARKTAA